MFALSAAIAVCGGLHLLNYMSDRIVSQYVPYFDSWFPHIEIWLAAGIFAYAMRKAPLYEVPPLERWIGVGIVAASLGVPRLGGGVRLQSVRAADLSTALFGRVLIVGGISMLRWAGPAILFLLFMFPLPSFSRRRC